MERLIIFISGFVIELRMGDVHKISTETLTTLNLMKVGIVFWWIYIYIKDISAKYVIPNFNFLVH